MGPSKVFLSGAPADAAFVQQLAQALVAIGVPVFLSPPSGPMTPDTTPPAIVLVLSRAALASPEFVATLERYEGLVLAQPTITVAPVAMEQIPPDAIAPWLRPYPPVVAPSGAADPLAATADAVLRRLGLARQPQAADPLLPLAAGLAISAGLPAGQALPGVASRLATGSGAPASGRAMTWQMIWRQRIERRRRPLTLGAVGALALLALACIAFSLGSLSPGKDQAQRLDAGGAASSPAASATSSAAITPSPSGAHAQPTATKAHGTPTTTPKPTVTATPTPTQTTTPQPTPTLGPGAGLHGDYYTSTIVAPGTPVAYPNFGTFLFSKVDPIIDFDTHAGSPYPGAGPFDSRVSGQPFCVRWTGSLRPRYSESYTFTSHTDDGVKLWVNGQLLIDNWTIHGDTANSGTTSAALTAGQLYSITLEYYENGQDGATMALQWQSASQALEIVPQTQLYPAS